jgi:hypothetical protein
MESVCTRCANQVTVKEVMTVKYLSVTMLRKIPAAKEVDSESTHTTASISVRAQALVFRTFRVKVECLKSERITSPVVKAGIFCSGRTLPAELDSPYHPRTPLLPISTVASTEVSNLNSD